tara:strand:+ start:267 stop:629 length:363 start_codon:yes stop_codon:yes gene_type:complete
MRLGQKIKKGLKLGAKIGAGVLGTAGVIGAGLFALGGKAGGVARDPSEDFMTGRGSIANVPTDQLDSLFPVAPKGQQGGGGAVVRTQPKAPSTDTLIRRRVNDVPEGFIPPPTGRALIID